jgi:hypothetical protein
MFKFTKEDKKCLMKIGFGFIVIMILFKLFKNTSSKLVEGQRVLTGEDISFRAGYHVGNVGKTHPTGAPPWPASWEH